MTIATRRTLHIVYWLIAFSGLLLAARPAFDGLWDAWDDLWRGPPQDTGADAQNPIWLDRSEGDSLGHHKILTNPE